jgi:UDP-glucose 4-epimerase
MTQTVLVTGAAGFIASHLVDALLRHGYKVRAADRNTPAPNLATAAQSPAFRYHVADLADSAACAELCAGMDAVLHFAAMASVPEGLRRPEQCRRDTFLTTRNLLDAGPGRLILASTAAVYGHAPSPVPESAPLEPLNPYARAKADSEAALKASDVPGVCLRYFNVYGPRQQPDSPYAGVITRFVDHIRRGEPIHLHGDGGQTRDFLHVHDAVNATLLALRADANSVAINVGTGQAVSLLELIAAIEQLTGCRAEVIHEPPREGDIRHSRADIATARRLLGFESRVSLKAGLATLLES